MLIASWWIKDDVYATAVMVISSAYPFPFDCLAVGQEFVVCKGGLVLSLDPVFGLMVFDFML